MARRKKTTSKRSTKFGDEAHIGRETLDWKSISEEDYPNKIMESLRHYGYFYERKSYVSWATEWIKKNSPEDLKAYKASEDWRTSPTLASLMKMELMGADLDASAKDFIKDNLETIISFGQINIDNNADNVIPGTAEASFNIRFNNLHTSNSLKKKLNKIFSKISKKNKSKYKIDYRISGEAFLTKPNTTTFMVQNIIKKITKITPKLSTTGGTSDARFIRKICPCLEFGLVGKTMHKVDEATSLKDLKNLTKIYQNILQNYFK